MKKHKKQAGDGGLRPPSPISTSAPMMVRVRMLKPTVTAWGPVVPGMVLTVPEGTAAAWFKKGYAMEDKMVDGPEETKDVARG